MGNEVARYLLGSLGGLTLLAGSVGSVLALDHSGDPAVASLSDMAVSACEHAAAVTACTGPGQAVIPADVIFKDGTYGADGRYATPGGEETIGVLVSVHSGAVTAVSVEVHALSPTARQFQVQFSTLFADAVVGRALKDVELSRVAGASLTSVGFNDAIAQIAEQAHA